MRQLDDDWIWRGESKPLKTNATGGCLAHHTKKINQTNIYGNRSMSLRDVRRYYCQVTQAIVVWPYLATRFAAENNLTRYCGKWSSQRKTVQVLRAITSRSGQVSHCHHCYASQMTGDRNQRAAITGWRDGPVIEMFKNPEIEYCRSALIIVEYP